MRLKNNLIPIILLLWQYVFIYVLKFSGTLDISIVEIKDKKFDMKSVCGDAHLGLLLRYLPYGL